MRGGKDENKLEVILQVVEGRVARGGGRRGLAVLQLRGELLRRELLLGRERGRGRHGAALRL